MPALGKAPIEPISESAYSCSQATEVGSRLQEMIDMSAIHTAQNRRARNDFSTIEMDRQSELVLSAKAGDAEAFGHLYETYLDRIYRYIYFRVTDEQTAEDLISQVFT